MSRDTRKILYEQLEKEARRLLKRYDELHKQQRVWHKQKANILFDGYVRSFRLKSEYNNNPYRYLYEHILSLINSFKHGQFKDITGKQHLKFLYPDEFAKLNEKEQEMFGPRMVKTKWSWSNDKELAYFFKYAHVFELFVEKHYKEQYYFDPDIESELASIRNRLWYTDMMAYKYLERQSNKEPQKYKRIENKNKLRNALGEDDERIP